MAPITVSFVKHSTKAIVPNNAHRSDVGYDLVAIEKTKKFGNRCIMYDTGISISVPPGYYTEVVPRSSIVKTGWMLANGVGIIDPEYTGTIKICLIQIDPDMPELELPFTICQLLIKKAEYAIFEEAGVATAFSYASAGQDGQDGSNGSGGRGGNGGSGGGRNWSWGGYGGAGYGGALFNLPWKPPGHGGRGGGGGGGGSVFALDRRGDGGFGSTNHTEK